MSQRRWRVAIGLVVVVVAGGLHWLARPNLDPRLVGDWQRGTGGPGSLIRRFSADGVLTTLTGSPSRPEPMMSGYFWNVEGDEIVLTRHRTILSRLQNAASDLWAKFHGVGTIRLRPPRYRILQLDADTLRIQAIPVNPRPVPYPEEIYRRLLPDEVAATME